MTAKLLELVEGLLRTGRAPEHQLVYVPGVVGCLLISRLSGYLGVRWRLSYQAPQQSGCFLTITYIISLMLHIRRCMLPRFYSSSSSVGTIVKRLLLLSYQLLDINSLLLLWWRDVDLIVAEEELAR